MWGLIDFGPTIFKFQKHRVDRKFGDTSGYGEKSFNLAPDLAGGVDLESSGIVFPTLGLLDAEVDDLSKFMKILIDERVRWGSSLRSPVIVFTQWGQGQ